MKFKPGDKVSFLNEKLDGVVSAVIRAGVCKVVLEDGFDIEVEENQLIKTGETDVKEEIIFHDKDKKPENEIILNTKRKFLLGDIASVYFISVPSEEHKVLTGKVSFYILNNSEYEILFSIALKKTAFAEGVSAGMLSPDSEKHIITVDRTETMDWLAVYVQLIIHKFGAYDFRNPVNKEIQIQLPNLNADPQLAGNAAFAKVTELISLKKLPEISDTEIKDLVHKFNSPLETVKQIRQGSENKKNNNLLSDSQYGILRNSIEVDLHIQHLMGEYQNLSNSEIIQVQLKHFRKELDKALVNHFHKITFIHGVGAGTLRHEINRELRAYDGITFHDAPFEKYGYGATEVFLH